MSVWGKTNYWACIGETLKNALSKKCIFDLDFVTTM